MTFDEFIGQDTVKAELKNTIGHHVHVLLRGRSGFGKTTLAEITANECGPYDLQAVKSTSSLSFDPEAVTHIIDEVHRLREPEVIFPEMERAKFILCTTESGDLIETLVNRCIVLTLQPYSLTELIQIGGQIYEYDPSVLVLVASRSRGVPRVMLQLCQRVGMSLTNPDYFSVKEYLESIGVHDQGYTDDDLRYLDTLERLGQAGKDTLASSLRLPVNTVTNEIEPFLLEMGRITIRTGVGRKLT